jgi:hypothetical protein
MLGLPVAACGVHLPGLGMEGATSRRAAVRKGELACGGMAESALRPAV